jgi:hypothetical protein
MEGEELIKELKISEFFDMKCLFLTLSLNLKCECNSKGIILVLSTKELRPPIFEVSDGV